MSWVGFKPKRYGIHLEGGCINYGCKKNTSLSEGTEKVPTSKK